MRWYKVNEAIPDSEEHHKQKQCFGARHMVTFMLFLGMANAYVMRTNMSVAIVAMVNHTAIFSDAEVLSDECAAYTTNSSALDTLDDVPIEEEIDGSFVWDTKLQGFILGSFFYGYVVTQIPFGILSQTYGAKYFLGVGMLINSVVGLLVPLAAQKGGYGALIATRVIQGLGEGPIVPCTHTMLAKWIPPNERSRMGAFVYAGAQFGTVISMPLSGLLAKYGFAGGWPSIFYVFGIISTIWSVAFLFLVYEDPSSHKHISPEEKSYIMKSLWGSERVSTAMPTPWKSIALSLPFWAILVSHVAQNWGYETLMTELPTFMKQVLHFDIQQNGFLSALPYLAMWVFSIAASHVADWMITSGCASHTTTRKVVNTIGQWSPGIALIGAAYTGCNPVLTVAILTIGVGLNGGAYSGFKVNHMDISPRFAGVLMSITNCMANVAGFMAPTAAGIIINNNPSQAQWRKVFFIASATYLLGNLFYIIFASAKRQAWDKKQEDEARVVKPEAEEINQLPSNILLFQPFGSKGDFMFEKQQV